jgi:hypothetical protein
LLAHSSEGEDADFAVIRSPNCLNIQTARVLSEWPVFSGHLLLMMIMKAKAHVSKYHYYKQRTTYAKISQSQEKPIQKPRLFRSSNARAKFELTAPLKRKCAAQIVLESNTRRLVEE